MRRRCDAAAVRTCRDVCRRGGGTSTWVVPSKTPWPARCPAITCCSSGLRTRNAELSITCWLRRPGGLPADADPLASDARRSKRSSRRIGVRPCRLRYRRRAADGDARGRSVASRDRRHAAAALYAPPSSRGICRITRRTSRAFCASRGPPAPPLVSGLSLLLAVRLARPGTLARSRSLPTGGQPPRSAARQCRAVRSDAVHAEGTLERSAALGSAVEAPNGTRGCGCWDASASPPLTTRVGGPITKLIARFQRVDRTSTASGRGVPPVA